MNEGAGDKPGLTESGARVFSEKGRYILLVNGSAPIHHGPLTSHTPNSPNPVLVLSAGASIYHRLKNDGTWIRVLHTTAASKSVRRFRLLDM